MRVCATLLSLLAMFVVGCPKSPPPSAEAGASDASTTAISSAKDAAAAGASSGSGEDVEPVYPIEANAPVVPLAAKLCEALTAMPEKKRSEYCKSIPGVVITTECTRMLSAALRYKAIDLAESDVAACVDAFTKSLDGCDWVGPFPPTPPAACQGILKGKIALGQKCRSSLECAGDLRCAGVGPTNSGRCSPGKEDGEICGGNVDTLAGYTRQLELERQHPECKTKCVKHKCAPPVTEGKPCQTTADCATGLACVTSPGPAPKVGLPPKTCIAGKPAGRAGDPCPGGECEGDLQCIKGKCAARKGAGEECQFDFECRGGCVKADAGDKGKCGPRCDIR